MAEGNGIDAAVVYGLLREVAKAVTSLQADMTAMKQDVAEVKRDIRDLKADVSTLRETLTGYYASVMGHGILISEPEDRVRRIERRLDMGAPS